MENDLFQDHFEMSPIHAIGTPQSQQSETPISSIRYPVKINLQSNPIALPVRRANNDYGFENDQVIQEPKYKVIKFNSSRNIQQGFIRDFSENFVSKTIPVEKTFVRINYLKNKEKEVKTVEDIVGCSTISTVNQSINEKSQVGQPQKQKKEKTKQTNLSKSISKTTITDSQKNSMHSVLFHIILINGLLKLKGGHNFKKRSSISNSSKGALQSARSMSKKGGNTPSKNNSISERKSNKKNYQSIIKTKSPSHKIANNSSSSCCSCCRSHASPLSSSEKNMVLPSEGGQSSVYHSISQRQINHFRINEIAQSVNSKKSNQRSSFNTHFDLSSEWNHKSSILSQSGQNKTSEYLLKKLQQISERKQEKQEIKQIKHADQLMRKELYGMFSRQSRDMRQKKILEQSMFEQMQKQLQIVDPEKVHKVLFAKKFSVQKNSEKEEQEQRENQKKSFLQKLKDYDHQVKQNNYLATERKSKSRENSQKKDIQVKPWGIDQRKFDSKPAEAETSKVKVVKKEQIDLKVLFSKNETVNQLLKQIKNEQKKKKAEEEQSQTKKNLQSQSSKEIRQEKKIDANEFNKKMEERLQKILEEKKNKANELKAKKQDLSQKLTLIEKERKESMTKCRKVPFKPTQEQIEKAFNNLKEEEENQQNISNQENQTQQKSQVNQVQKSSEPSSKSNPKSKKSKIQQQI